MKSLATNILCCSCKLYKLGLLIAFLYLIPNILIIISVFGSDYDDYTLPFFCALIVLTSVLLIKGLKEERHILLLPWLANIMVLILFNMLLVVVQFAELSRQETKYSFYLELGFLAGLEIQILCWYIVYCLLKVGYRKSKLLTTKFEAISKIVESQKKDYYKINLISSEHLIKDEKVYCV